MPPFITSRVVYGKAAAIIYIELNYSLCTTGPGGTVVEWWTEDPKIPGSNTN